MLYCNAVFGCALRSWRGRDGAVWTRAAFPWAAW